MLWRTPRTPYRVPSSEEAAHTDLFLKEQLQRKLNLP